MLIVRGTKKLRDRVTGPAATAEADSTTHADPAHPEHAERQEWIGRHLDVEAFDPAEFEENLRNQRLTALDD